MKFCAYFDAADADRLTPFKDNKLKDAEISPLQASLDNFSMAEGGSPATLFIPIVLLLNLLFHLLSSL